MRPADDFASKPRSCIYFLKYVTHEKLLENVESDFYLMHSCAVARHLRITALNRYKHGQINPFKSIVSDSECVTTKIFLQNDIRQPSPNHIPLRQRKWITFTLYSLHTHEIKIFQTVYILMWLYSLAVKASKYLL